MAVVAMRPVCLVGLPPFSSHQHIWRWVPRRASRSRKWDCEESTRTAAKGVLLEGITLRDDRGCLHRRPMWTACTGIAHTSLRRTVAEQLRMHMGCRSSRLRKGQGRSQCKQQRDGNFQPHKQPLPPSYNKTCRTLARIQISVDRYTTASPWGYTAIAGVKCSIGEPGPAVTLILRPGIQTPTTAGHL
jgi:hypothetical protein